MTGTGKTKKIRAFGDAKLRRESVEGGSGKTTWASKAGTCSAEDGRVKTQTSNLLDGGCESGRGREILARSDSLHVRVPFGQGGEKT